MSKDGRPPVPEWGKAIPSISFSVEKSEDGSSETFNTAQNSGLSKRNKLPLPPGRTQIDWMRVTQSNPDVAGNKGQIRKISMDEVKQHNKAEDAWMVLKGKVYNVTPYLEYHPGGREILVKVAGKDVTSLFNKYHAWVNSEFLIGKCFLGILTTE
uniref:Cytochrome b5 heme-binding domain-containing protein n=1 Tax=Cyanoptyche gloeocystis TaxID=77922 RepID=A0A7S2NR37_9EUKA|mmetsp:Transcript_906/g.1605  ORF Transcript_906/g.1605 Transcript_906/m.1605 type:complete len:155 (+) Transcript_906:50-514(+)|eukprot:CAMPEP_0196664482 /NCGR_PEP_ID=MMETSP1086-20130531/57346_1 /TAXON_ID=77921 /ORGANISM="Cyanoptyche  gloeocystis , Strain SAG4.97" /LENGTH=154 /DNA_ID=CAMNT_0042000815 /DNA_START=47 /DNA_END=511 /DNA_ORIENTATION=+